ncbi:nodulin-like, Major facilitator superfamily domain protein [Artemisia annua]|uniref:Nodulin-like, Major facilitator superfamily domain protein n=1 Tax=Artemisia annua TaxID=35608 RepID=A0A2U1LEF4_ARTAN|nr:nodulin-like, Major facilitator superfamily domain protein [Artemisia annua]
MGHTDHTTATRHVEWRKWMVLVATIWIQAFTGTNFNFPSYSSELKSVLDITQVELNYLSMASDFGKLFGWCSGVLLLCFPTWVVLFMAAFLGLFGYGLQWLLVQRLVSLPYIMAFILCLSAGCSITWFNTVCFVLCIKNFPNNWPLAVSLSLSFNSITAPLYNLIATNINLNNKISTTSYLILNAFIPFITSIATLVPILQQPCPRNDLQINSKNDTHTFVTLYILAAVTGLYLFVLDTLSQNIFIVGALLLVLPFVVPKIVYSLKRVHNVEGPCYNLIEMNNYSDLSEERSSSVGAFNVLLEKDRLMEIGEEHSASMLVARCDFWLYYIAYFCGGTIGLVYSNNLGQICQSLGYGLETEELVTIYSTCSFFGRLISAVPDLSSCFYTPQMNTKRYTTRTGWLALSLVPMPIAFLVLVLSDTKASLRAATGLIGISSGFIFSAAVSITSELFGSKSSGINHNILITNIPLGSLLYGVLGGVIYDNNIKSSKETVFVGGSRF